MMCGAAQFHLSVRSPEYNQHPCSLSQSTRQEDGDGDSEHNLLPVGVLLDTEWRRETVPCQSEQCHRRGSGAMTRPDSQGCYFNSSCVDAEKQRSYRKTCIRPRADGWSVHAFVSICVNYRRNTNCRRKEKKMQFKSNCVFFSYTVVIVKLPGIGKQYLENVFLFGREAHKALMESVKNIRSLVEASIKIKKDWIRHRTKLYVW